MVKKVLLLLLSVPRPEVRVVQDSFSRRTAVEGHLPLRGCEANHRGRGKVEEGFFLRLFFSLSWPPRFGGGGDLAGWRAQATFT
jgi:hypothetical protein